MTGCSSSVALDTGSEQVITLDDAGRLSLPVPDAARRATLVVATRRFELSLTSLPSAATVAGAQERLNHLNFFAGEVDGELGDQTTAALVGFQRQHALAPTGALDSATVQRLTTEHGS